MNVVYHVKIIHHEHPLRFHQQFFRRKLIHEGKVRGEGKGRKIRQVNSEKICYLNLYWESPKGKKITVTD